MGRAAYALADVRLSRAAGSARVFAEATSVFGVVYPEVRGVCMPGRWVTAGIAFGGGPR